MASKVIVSVPCVSGSCLPGHVAEAAQSNARGGSRFGHLQAVRRDGERIEGGRDRVWRQHHARLGWWRWRATHQPADGKTSGDERGGGRHGRAPRQAGGLWSGGASLFGKRRLQFEAHVADVAHAQLRILLQQPLDQCTQARGQRRQRFEVSLFLQDRREHVRHGLALEGLPSGEHLVEHAAERPDVGTLVH